MSFDKFHENSNNLYRVESENITSGRVFYSYSSPVPLAPAIEKEIPEITFASRCSRFGGFQLSYKDKIFYEIEVISADPSFFKMFTFPFLEGDANSALIDPFSIVISERMAHKYFADENPFGKTMTVENKHEFTVTGVMKNSPHNSSIQLDLVVPFVFVNNHLSRMPSGWVNAITSYVQLPEYTTVKLAEKNITNLIQSNRSKKASIKYVLNPLTRIHLHTNVGFERSMGYVRYVYIFSVIAFIILVIACINFMNLSTARSSNRAKEIGMRKVVGAKRRNLITQFFSESLCLSFVALSLSILIVMIFLPAYRGSRPQGGDPLM